VESEIVIPSPLDVSRTSPSSGTLRIPSTLFYFASVKLASRCCAHVVTLLLPVGCCLRTLFAYLPGVTVLCALTVGDVSYKFGQQTLIVCAASFFTSAH